MLVYADDQVLDDIYQYHLPPTRRVPPLLWTRLRGDLPGYLADSEADGVIVINWYHRQFRSPTITVRTVGDNNGIFLIAGKQPSCDTSPKRISFSISTTSCLNTSLAPTEEAGPSPSNTLRSRDTGAGREDVAAITDRACPRFGLKSKEAAEDRQVPEMPLVFGAGAEGARYNLRKLGELTYHLARAARTEDLFSHCLFNYDWMYAKV